MLSLNNISHFLCYAIFFILLITTLMENKVYLSKILHLLLNNYLKIQAKLENHTKISGKPKTVFYMAQYVFITTIVFQYSGI